MPDKHKPECLQDSTSSTPSRASTVRSWRSTITTASWQASPLSRRFHDAGCWHDLLQLLLEVFSHLQGLCQSLKQIKESTSIKSNKETSVSVPPLPHPFASFWNEAPVCSQADLPLVLLLLQFLEWQGYMHHQTPLTLLLWIISYTILSRSGWTNFVDIYWMLT